MKDADALSRGRATIARAAALLAGAALASGGLEDRGVVPHALVVACAALALAFHARGERRSPGPIELGPGALVGLAAGLGASVLAPAVEAPRSVGATFALAGAAAGAFAGSRIAAAVFPIAALVVALGATCALLWPGLSDAGSGPALALVALVGLLAGAGLPGTRRRDLAAILSAVGAAAGLALAPHAFARAFSAWPDDAALAFALTPPGSDRAAARAAAASGDLRLRYRDVGAGALVVVDAPRAGNVRTLARDGRVLGSVPADPGESAADYRSPLLAATLALALGRPLERVAVLGLAEGLVPGALARAHVRDLFLHEPDAAVVRAHRDPGELFRAASGDPLGAARPLEATAKALDAVVGAPGERELASVRGRLAPGGLSLGILRLDARDLARTRAELGRFAAAFEDALAFRAPGARVLVLVGGAGPLDLARLRERLVALGAGDAARARDLAGAKTAEGVLARLVGGREGIAALARGERSELGPAFLAGVVPRARALPPSAADVDSFVAAAAPSCARDVSAMLSRLSPGAQGEELVAIAEAALGARLPVTAEALARESLAHAGARGDRVLGDVLLARGDEAGARASWARALEREPGLVSARLSLAAWHLLREELVSARAVLEPVLGREGDDEARVHYLLGRIDHAEKKYEAARRHFEKAGTYADASQRAAIAREQASLAAAAAGQDPREEQARRRFETARYLVEQARSDRDDGRTSEARKKLAKARELLERLLAERPNDSAVAFQLGVVRLALDDRDGAREAFELSARLDQTSALALYALGDLLAGDGRLEEARAAYELGRKRSGARLEARVALAIADLDVRQGRLEEAGRTLEGASAQAPRDPRIALNLGGVYAKLGRREAAAAAYRRFLEVAPPDDPVRPSVERVLERLAKPR